MQAQLGDEGFAFEDEDMSADLDDSDGEDFPTSDALPAPGGLYQEQTELQAGDESSAEAESSPGATLRNPSRLELMGLADRGARKEADGAPSGGQEQWEGSEKPTVADLDAMGWFDEAAENFEGPAGLPGTGTLSDACLFLQFAYQLPVPVIGDEHLPPPASTGATSC